MFPIIDISSWQFEDLYVSGSKEKRWYRNPTDNKLHLFKLPVSLTSDTWTNLNEYSGEMWSEKIASEIGNALGLCIHEVNIASLKVTDEVINHYGLDPKRLVQDNIHGALCTSFLKEGQESLIEGADMIMEYDFTYDRNKLRGDAEVYSFDLLFRLFNDYGFLPHLFNMIIFDILIGNTDRHQDNFGIIRNEATNDVRFAPFYDNASSLGREMTGRRVSLIIEDAPMFNAYLHGKKSSSLIKWGDITNFEKLNMFVLFKKIVSCAPQIKDYIRMLEVLSDNIIDGIINQVSEVMSENQKTFVSKVLKARRDLLLKEK
ncbi:HipA domain-containing protein [Paenibacillus sp. CGMCC 1.18879]|uniref:HipA domain-containing protein n=1 Tax=Paenibacillus sp. CGMCC 1.18879 TaxID=2834466 RepID=UPI001CA7FB4B|nr:HipA domain-containing protein [Paenibacillus sp. CGMCC 1.18879]MBY9081017.1 HipA domain-containing protein [Paenibacillus sp. CGMCC 1.18879]